MLLNQYKDFYKEWLENKALTISMDSRLHIINITIFGITEILQTIFYLKKK